MIQLILISLTLWKVNKLRYELLILQITTKYCSKFYKCDKRFRKLSKQLVPLDSKSQFTTNVLDNGKHVWTAPFTYEAGRRQTRFSSVAHNKTFFEIPQNFNNSRTAAITTVIGEAYGLTVIATV